ncbi:MAG: bacterial translation initiation factor 3 (bIF-3) [Parcubacteria group bacterium Athens0714_12]|nr:MAG: bacterial translation initiation factor 3 (bIF-3) [Parcubacteria group bacterium Athens0714_12]
MEISPKAAPPVAKLLNFGQFKYEIKKKEQKQKTKQEKIKIKGIRLSFKIGKGDIQLKLNQSKKFLGQGNKVKIEMILRGREKSRFDIARVIVENFIKELGEINIEQPISKQGNKLIALIGKK